MYPSSKANIPKHWPLPSDVRQQHVIRILIVNHYPLIRKGLQSLVDQQPQLQVCGEADGAEQALQQNALHLPDILILGIETQTAAGIELIDALSRQCKSTNIMVISRCRDPHYIERALRSGAAGFVCENASLEEIVHALHEIHNGYVYICEPMRSQVVEQLQLDSQAPAADRGVKQLTKREFTVFAQIAAGLTTRDIAKSLQISIKTVETHRQSIKRKLSLNNATELAQYAVKWRMENVDDHSFDVRSTVDQA